MLLSNGLGIPDPTANSSQSIASFFKIILTACSLVLSLEFQYMDQDSWNIACEGSTIEFQERNREYPLEIPFYDLDTEVYQ